MNRFYFSYKTRLLYNVSVFNVKKVDVLLDFIVQIKSLFIDFQIIIIVVIKIFLRVKLKYRLKWWQLWWICSIINIWIKYRFYKLLFGIFYIYIWMECVSKIIFHLELLWKKIWKINKLLLCMKMTKKCKNLIFVII